MLKILISFVCAGFAFLFSVSGVGLVVGIPLFLLALYLFLAGLFGLLSTITKPVAKAAKSVAKSVEKSVEK